jgi:DNA-binding PadR family transcriptional regulator
MPNSWTDITAEINNIAELKVVEYILRHTWGSQEYGVKKHITIDEFVNGRRRQDGSRMDKGTGLSERAVYDGLRKAVESGLIDEETDDSDRGRIKKSYSLRMRENRRTDEELQSLQTGVQSLHPPLQDVHPDPQTLQARGASDAPRTEKYTLERNVNNSNFERSHDDVENTRSTTGHNFGVDDADPDSSRGEDEDRRESRLVPSSDVAELRAAAVDAIGTRRAPAIVPDSATETVPPRGRPVGTSEERELLAAYLGDFVTQLGDEAPLSSTVTRTLKILKQATVPMSRWPDLLYEAKSITWEHSAQIKKKPTDPTKTASARVRIPYYLAVLESLVGLRPAPSGPEAFQAT